MLKFNAKKVSNLFLWLIIAMLLSSCSGKVNYNVLNKDAQIMVKESKTLIKQGKNEEGVKLLQLVKQIHKDDPALLKAESNVSPETLEYLKVDTISGFNKKKLRGQHTPTRNELIFWYLPDRLKDLMDMVTFELSSGPQIGAGAWVTRAGQAVAFTGYTTGGGVYQKTLLGLRQEATTELAVGPVGGGLIAGGRVGIGGLAYTADTIAFHTPGDPLYQDYRDYWAIGAKVGIIVFGVEAELHPLEIVDFFGGLFLLDFLGDDFATSRSLDYTSKQKTMIKNFAKKVRTAGKSGIKEYSEKYPTVFPQKH